MLYDETVITATIQFTLLVHRINLPTERPPDTGIKFVNEYRSASGSYTTNTVDASINNLSVGTGQALLGLLGRINYYAIEDLNAATCSMNLDFTSSAAVTSTRVAFSFGYD